MEWSKRKLPIENLDVYAAIASDGTYIQALNAGGGESYVFSREQVTHWVIGLCENQKGGKAKFFEPTYQQKLMILREIGIWKEIALEVMPPEYEVIDREDVYHLWEFQYPHSFIFNYRPILDEPESYEREFQDIKYHVVTSGPIRYLFFKSKDEANQIGWRKKQNLKNRVAGFDDTAVEIITEEMSGREYGCLICLPRNKYLDFGLE